MILKKNLEIKTHLCEAAEKLADEEDVISTFHQLQKLHQEFRNTGPVAKRTRRYGPSSKLPLQLKPSSPTTFRSLKRKRAT